MHLNVTSVLCHERYALISLDIFDNRIPNVLIFFSYIVPCEWNITTKFFTVAPIFAQFIALCRCTNVTYDDMEMPIWEFPEKGQPRPKY